MPRGENSCCNLYKLLEGCKNQKSQRRQSKGVAADRGERNLELCAAHLPGGASEISTDSGAWQPDGALWPRRQGKQRFWEHPPPAICTHATTSVWAGSVVGHATARYCWRNTRAVHHRRRRRQSIIHPLYHRYRNVVLLQKLSRTHLLICLSHPVIKLPIQRSYR